MKPSKIHEVLDLAFAARQQNLMFSPCFSGAAGLGKSEIAQQWVKGKQKLNPNFGFIDLRLAYLEAPDMIGLPELTVRDGRRITAYFTPEFWPADGEGLIYLDEINRGTTGMMNCCMQLLTDRKIHGYTLPPGWLIAAAVNPDSAEYDVNAMDTALKDRLEFFDIDYDHNTFVEFMDEKDWCTNIQMFVKSGTWTYKDASAIGKDGKYISPRTWSKLNAAHKAGALNNKQMHSTICISVLGKDIGNEFWKFVHDDAPVTAQEILRNKKKALEKLEKQSEPSNYQGDKIAITVESITKNYGGQKATKDQIDEKTMAEVAKIIPSDQALVLIKGCGMKSNGGNIVNYFRDFCLAYPDLKDVLKSNIKLNKTT